MLPHDLQQADDELWDRLLALIDRGSVVPIVGRDLLVVDDAGQTLHDSLAAELKAALAVDVDLASGGDAGPLNAVATEYIRTASDDDDDRIYAKLAEIAQRRATAIPAPLAKLAAIDRFSLFVTTTFDDLLARAVAEARGKPPQVLAFATSPAVPNDLGAMTGPTVYHLFGRLAKMSTYVVTEEDALEFVCLLLGGRDRPEQLLRELGNRNLLLIGCSFPSWFARFFLRLARNTRLAWAARDKVAYIVDAGARNDGGLVQFLRTYRTRTNVFTQFDAVGFVNELSRRWSAHAGAAAPAAPAMNDDAIFVSYAHEDGARVDALVAALRQQQLDVWFDKDNLHPGDAFDPAIRNNINRASAFIPIVSRRALAETRRYFLDEWREALAANRRVAFDDRFLFPIVIDDDVKPDDPAVPPEFRAVQWTTILSDQVPPDLVERLNAAVRRKKRGDLR